MCSMCIGDKAQLFLSSPESLAQILLPHLHVTVKYSLLCMQVTQIICMPLALAAAAASGTKPMARQHNAQLLLSYEFVIWSFLSTRKVEGGAAESKSVQEK